MKRHAYVTGAGGCVGRQLLSELIEEGWTVTALLLASEAETFAFGDDPRVTSVIGDLNSIDPATIPEGAVVFHLAAQVHSVPKTAEQRERFFLVNRDGTAAVATAARDRNASGFVFLSTIAVYGGQLDLGACDEQTPSDPITPYAQSKLAAEESLVEILGDAVPYLILRPAVVYGPGDRGNFARLIRAVVAGRFLVIDGGAARKNTLYVKNLARVLVDLSTHLDDCRGAVLNVADPHPRSMRDIALTVGEAAGVDVKLVNVPSWFLKPAAWMGDLLGLLAGREMPISSRRVGVMTTDSVVRTERLEAILQGRVRFATLAEGVSEYLATIGRQESCQ